MMRSMSDSSETSNKSIWATQSMGKTLHSSDDQKIGTELMDDEAVIMVTGNNMFGDKVFSYVKFTLKNFLRMREAMESGQNFKPSDFGEVVAAGRGEPSQELKDEMRIKYGLVDIPKADPAREPEGMNKAKLFDDDEGF